MLNEKPRDYFVPTNLSPLWTGAFDNTAVEKLSTSVLKYIEKLQLDKYPGGVPNTLYRTGEQWDFPNVWPPMQYILIEGLNNLGTEAAKSLSSKWSHRWVLSNFAAYRDSRAMFEKVCYTTNRGKRIKLSFTVIHCTTCTAERTNLYAFMKQPEELQTDLNFFYLSITFYLSTCSFCSIFYILTFNQANENKSIILCIKIFLNFNRVI